MANQRNPVTPFTRSTQGLRANSYTCTVAERLKYSQIANRIDVEAWEDAIGFEPKYVKDGKKGPEAVGFCLDPWGLHKHGDTTGKLAINRDERLFNCWVCGGGSLLSYTMALKDVDEDTALEWLYQFTRPTEETQEEFESEIEKLLFEEKQSKPAPPWFNENVLKKWMMPQSEAEIPEWDGFLEWLEQRGISLDTAEQFKIGLNLEYTVRSSKGDHTAPAIIFPHYWGGRLVGWQARWLTDKDRPKHIRKYDNTHDFPRESTIFNYEGVYLSEQPIIVVESVPTMLFLASHGYSAVATFGGSVTPEQLRLLRICHQGVIVARDNDAPGKKFEQALVSGLERFVNVKIVEPVPGEGADLGDLVELENCEEALHLLISEATIPSFGSGL